MNWIKFSISVSLLLCLISCTEKDQQTSDNKIEESQSKYLIEAEDLLSIIDQDSIVLLDLQRPEDFQKGHLPYAINIWRSELNNASFKYDGMLPEKDFLENILGKKGITDDSHLVLYDNRGSCEATRLWWVLKQYGYDRMAILNGGTQAWQQLDSLTKIVTKRTPGDFRFPEGTTTQTSDNILMEKLSELINQESLLVLDTRSKDEYEGLSLKKGALWAGKIPGSIHIDWMEAVDQSNYRFKEISELQNIYKEVLNNERLAITYCHSGVRSTHTFFVLTELLGRENVKNYDGSWVEWTHHLQPDLVN
ncbi:sulfurtransferase [Ekhidna sp.]|uniref:sulfurtransferase n=1 Tax=Ekhidna sp. TaxID=2608089 RepID=UPI003B5116D0